MSSFSLDKWLWHPICCGIAWKLDIGTKVSGVGCQEWKRESWPDTWHLKPMLGEGFKTLIMSEKKRAIFIVNYAFWTLWFCKYLWPKKIRPVSKHEVGFVWYWRRLSFICCAIEYVLPTVYGLVWFAGTFGLCGWIPVCIPPAAFELKWAGGENFPGFSFTFGTLRVFGSHGNEFFGNVSVCTFKFINRHVHPPEMANNPSIWDQLLGLWIFILCG